MNKKILISTIRLFAGREYDQSNRPAKWAESMVEVFLVNSYPYEIHITFVLGTGMAYNENYDVIFCKSAAEVTECLHNMRADFQHYENIY